MNNKITVSLVEDNPGFRSTLVNALTDSGQVEVKYLATDMREGLALLHELPTDVLLVDLELPDGDGYTLIAEADRVWPDCKIVVISVFDEGHKVLPAIELGAKGYIVKGGGIDDIQHQIQQLLKGESPMSPSLAKHLFGRVRAAGPHVALATDDGVSVAGADEVICPEPGAAVEFNARNEQILLLPPQEVETIRLIAKGCTAHEVAKHMGVQVCTIRTYLTRIYRRLKVNNKTEALHELGLIDDTKPMVTTPHAAKRRKKA